ncbi:tyrosine-type recombinase/integrase [Jannaschia seohaensis]|uniref:Phage integrase family protein n=1 Tax=Jannaschia seohaensis TaxID=475081 RepID=A0A2Y9C5X0_9RHOB|nr:integrase family protein [Jannaschia seohaensis]PWJ21427.1 phage integrase family protein [Jannaschia seohaensis]SSA42033.1 Phage integrase family protein [Jannaschia seohaensis]
MPKLTETFATKLPQASQGTQKYWDTEIRGFVLYVGKRSKTWYYQRDVGGRTRRALIGRHPVITAATARQTALGFALEWGRGAGKTIQIGAPTLQAAMDAYLARPKLRSDTHRLGLRQQFDLHLKEWMRLPLDEITKSMVVAKHRSMADRPSAANHLLKYFRTVWNHARRTADLPECPTMAIEWYEERPNGSVIEDLAEWRRTIEGLPNPIHSAFFELLLFTGLRKSEALTLEWKNVHEDRIHLPMTKNGRSFDLPILQVHHEILAPVRGLHRRWVFPSSKGPDGRMTSPQRMKWSPHAHRRTFATVAMEAGVLEEFVGRLLNHTPLSITGQRYVRPSTAALVPSMELTCTKLQGRLAS